MEHRREVKEEEEIVEEKAEESPNEAHKSATFSDPTPQTRGSTLSTLLESSSLPSARLSGTLSEGEKALGNVFAECHTRECVLCRHRSGKALFAEFLPSGTWQNLCRGSEASTWQYKGDWQPADINDDATWHLFLKWASKALNKSRSNQT